MSAAVSASNPVEAVAKRFAMVSKKQKIVSVHIVFRFFVLLLCIHGNIDCHNRISVHYRSSSYYLNFIYFYIILNINVSIFFIKKFSLFFLYNCLCLIWWRVFNSFFYINFILCLIKISATRFIFHGKREKHSHVQSYVNMMLKIIIIARLKIVVKFANF